MSGSIFCPGSDEYQSSRPYAPDPCRNTCRSSRQCLLLLSNFNQHWNEMLNFCKAPHLNTFHENPFRGYRVVKADGQTGTFLQLFAPTKRVAQYSIQRCITSFPPSLWANAVAVLSTWSRPHRLKSLLVTIHNNLSFYSIYHYNSTVK